MSPRATNRRIRSEELSLPFKPRARLLQLLGDELIGSPRLAVFELVKNAYDADAETVSVILEDIDTPEASIIVEDDGEGMSLDTIRNIWLVPAHDHRARQRDQMRRTRKGRLPLGEKGLGRFAAHKLGNRIEVVTRADAQPECVVSIDWSVLIGNQNLSDAMVRVSTRRPSEFRGKRTGTRVTVSDLRDQNWTRGEVRRLQRQITTISSPFANVSDDFSPELKVPGHEDWTTDVPDVGVLLNRAPWDFEFSFADGIFNWKYRFNGVTGIPIEPRETIKSDEVLLVRAERDPDETDGYPGLGSARPRPVVADSSLTEGIGPVRGTIMVFDRDRPVLQRLGEGRLVEHYLDEHGGIRVYRDGIRVYNYGEPGDDWLGLDLRRVNAPTRNISRNIVVGAVDLSLEASHELKEKTNREGFVENSALERLKRIVVGALTPLEVERKKDKDSIRALTGRGRDPETKSIRQPLRKLRKAARKHKVKDIFEPLIDQVEREYNELRDSMLRAGLSGVGLAIVFHEVEHGVRALCALIEEGGDQDAIRTRSRELARMLGGFTDLLRKGSRRTGSLKRLIRRARDINQVRFRKHHVRLDCPAVEEGAPDITSSFVFGLALGALNNLLDNSFYWLKVRWPDERVQPRRAIHISVNRDLADGPAIVIADNGTGFDDEPEELIRPFFSRRPEGMGVGLYYANLVMELGDGRLAFPGAREADVPDEFDGAVSALIFPPDKEA